MWCTEDASVCTKLDFIVREHGIFSVVGFMYFPALFYVSTFADASAHTCHTSAGVITRFGFILVAASTLLLRYQNVSRIVAGEQNGAVK